MVVSTFYYKRRQLTVPTCCRFESELFKVLACCLYLQILQRAIGAGGRERHLDNQLRIFRIVELKIRDDFTSCHLRKVIVDRKLTPETVISYLIHVLISIVANRLRERDSEICIVGTRPSVGDTISGDKGVVFNSYLRPQSLSVVIIDSMIQIEDDAAVFRRESIFMDASAFGSSELCFNIIVVEHHFVITRRCFFCLMRETRTIAILGMRRCSRIQFQFAGSRHDENITEIRMTSAVKMCMTETYYCRIFILISSAIFIHSFLIDAIYIMRNCVGVRT